MNKLILKKLFLIIGIIISLFSIFLDFLYKNNFYFGASQLILLLFGISLIFGYWYNKIFIWMVGLIIGINLVVFNKQYFGLINESPVVKENLEKIDKEVVELIIDKRFNDIEKFFLLSESYIDQNQFQKYFAYKNNNSSALTKKDTPEFIKENIKLIKNKIEQNYFLNFEDIISQKLDVKVLKEIKYEKYKIIVFEWNAINGNKAVGNIYVPINLDKKLPMVFSVPGCGENLWTDYPNETNPQHRMGLLATNEIVSATTIATCSNSEFTTNARYEILSDMSGGKLNDSDLAIVIWLRFLRIYQEFKSLKINQEKIGITGYSNGASIIKLLLNIDKDIKYVALVGTAVRSTQKKEKKFLSYPAERIVDSENENFYHGSGSKELNKIIYKAYNDFKVKNTSVLTNLITFYHDKKFQIVSGRKDTAVPNHQKAFMKDEIKKINKLNENISGTKNVTLIENDMDHNFSNENNIAIAKFFNQNFNSPKQLDLNFKYKKNDKKNLNPKIFYLDLKKLYLNEFKRKTYNQKIDLENVEHIFKINNLEYNRPILLLRKAISIGDSKIIAKLYAQKIKDEIHGYFYEFENSSIKNKNKSDLFLYSKKEFDFELLLKSINENNITYLTILPGYSLLNAKFNTTGNLAKYLMNLSESPSLAGLAFQSINNLKKFSDEKYGNKVFDYYSFGTESNFISLINKSVLNNISKIKLYEYIEISEFFSDQNLFSIPAIFFVKGINTIYDDIIKLQNDNKVKIMSYGNIENYRVYN